MSGCIQAVSSRPVTGAVCRAFRETTLMLSQGELAGALGVSSKTVGRREATPGEVPREAVLAVTMLEIVRRERSKVAPRKPGEVRSV